MGSFVDRVKISVKSGNGGNGAVSFHREKYVMNGGPDGGDGGDGGDIVFVADPNMHTLLDFRFHSKYFAENGEDGRANRCKGKNGSPMIIKVPVGTIVRDEETNRILADMDQSGETRTVLKGGKGGWGNHRFATATRQAPNFSRPGTKNLSRVFILELKTIADVGLVGFPNVGKSSILSVITSAKPKIANYHFTTLTPNLGIVSHYGNDIVIADIPGLIEGASSGAGLGHDFLRHIERTRLLLHVVDASGSEGRDPVSDLEAINQEIQNYGLPERKPQIIVCNKMDLEESVINFPRIADYAQKLRVPVYGVSAATHSGFSQLLDKVADMLSDLPPVLHFEEEELPELTDSEGFRVTVDHHVFLVIGPVADRIMDGVRFDDPESVNWFHRSLKRSGIIDALRKAGATEGATVQIGEMSFDFIE